MAARGVGAVQLVEQNVGVEQRVLEERGGPQGGGDVVEEARVSGVGVGEGGAEAGENLWPREANGEGLTDDD